jgi:hypothetical protein
MEARRCVEVTGVLAGNREMGGGAQRAGVGAARAVVDQRMGGQREEVTCVLADGVELADGTESRWAHQWWRRG